MDWGFKTEPQPGMAGRQITINQGRVTGGSTAINAMMYVRGNPGNFDQWNAMGADGWAYKDVLPYFKKSEDFEGGASEYHGAGGPLSIRVCPDDVSRRDPFRRGATELGYDGPEWDYNGARQENGAGFLQFHIGAGRQAGQRRDGVSRPVEERKNLTVELNAPVDRVIVEGGRAVGVAYRKGGQTQQARAAKRSDRQRRRVPVAEAAHAVGHRAGRIICGRSACRSWPMCRASGRTCRTTSSCRWSSDRRPISANTTLLTGSVMFLKTRGGMTAAPPDLQLNFTPGLPGPLAPMLGDLGGPACIFLPIMVQPFSTGRCSCGRLNPRTRRASTRITSRCAADVEVLVEGVQARSRSRQDQGVRGDERRRDGAGSRRGPGRVRARDRARRCGIRPARARSGTTGWRSSIRSCASAA